MSDKEWYKRRDALLKKYGHVCDAMFASIVYGQFAWNKDEQEFLDMPKPGSRNET